MKSKQYTRIVFSIGSLPIVWGILQGYHLLVCRPIITWILATFPYSIYYPQQPYPFLVALFNLVLFGTTAMLWPHLGFGKAWKPSRRQSMAIFSFLLVCLIIPSFVDFWGHGNPFQDMGMVIWTITPIEEEILFRGFLYALLLRLFRCSPDSSWSEILPVLVLGAAWFSLWHVYPPAIEQYGWQLVGIQVVLTFFAGLLFNGLRYWTGSIWLIIPVHAAGNFMISAL